MALVIANLMFVLQLHTGVIIPTDKVDGRTIYSIPSANRVCLQGRDYPVS
jgi:hypothetical protein